MNRHVLVVLFLLGLLIIPVVAQTDADVARLDDKITRHLETEMHGWTHRRVDPIKGSNRTIINHWQTSNRVVTVSIVRYDSANQAKETMQPFIKYYRQKEELKGFGDEAYAWGYGLSNIIFRRGRFIVSLSAYADVESDSDARSLTPEKKSDRERSEMKRLTDQFARHAASAIDAP